MRAQLDFVAGAFRAGYAPREWKRKHFGWDMDAEVAKAWGKISATQSIGAKEFRGVLAGLFRATKDYHVGYKFHATERATLPFNVRAVDGHVYLVRIDRAKLPETSFPFATGDELVEFGGRPAIDVLRELTASLGGNTAETDTMLAELLLVNRRADQAVDVPRGPIVLTIRRKGSAAAASHQLAWEYRNEDVAADDEPVAPAMPPALLWRTPLFARGAKEEEEKNPYALGARKSFLPAFGKKIMETPDSEPFHAYAFRAANGKTIGYLRIGNYGGAAKELAAFAELITRFEETTDALVIDQLNNPGGYVFYLYGLAGMLTEQALATPRHRVSLTSSDVMQSVETLRSLEGVDSEEKAKKAIGETFYGYPVTYAFAELLRDFCRFQIEEWNAGHKLSAPYHLYGVDRINPHPKARYTKPILLVINSLDFSGGDFFPAILQDNKRVVVMGSRTAGAGGYVLKVTYPNLFGLAQFTYTGSLAERVDKIPLENLGVKPDVPYTTTKRDLEEDHADFTAAILKTIQGMTR